MITLDDPTLEAINKGQEDHNMSEEWDFYSYDIHWLNMKNYIEDQRRTWRNDGMKTAQHERCIEEVEMRTRNKWRQL
jgi:hypothetical protein